jgi:hypothetical protein
MKIFHNDRRLVIQKYLLMTVVDLLSMCVLTIHEANERG